MWNIYYNVIYFCDQSWIFSIITPVFSSVQFYLYSTFKKTTMCASQCPEKLTHKQNEYSKNVSTQLKIKAKEYRCVLRNDLKITTVNCSTN